MVPNIIIMTAKRVSASPAWEYASMSPTKWMAIASEVRPKTRCSGSRRWTEVRDAKGQPDADVREDPREKHSSEKLGEHPNRLSARKVARFVGRPNHRGTTAATTPRRLVSQHRSFSVAACEKSSLEAPAQGHRWGSAPSETENGRAPGSVVLCHSSGNPPKYPWFWG